MSLLKNRLAALGATGVLLSGGYLYFRYRKWALERARLRIALEEERRERWARLFVGVGLGVACISVLGVIGYKVKKGISKSLLN